LEKEDLRAMGLKTGPMLAIMKIISDLKMNLDASGNNGKILYMLHLRNLFLVLTSFLFQTTQRLFSVLKEEGM
jgi:hypothetical protein